MYCGCSSVATGKSNDESAEMGKMGWEGRMEGRYEGRKETVKEGRKERRREEGGVMTTSNPSVQ